MTTVTMDVEELAKMVKHGSGGGFYFNLPRIGEQRYHRCLRIDTRDEVLDDPKVHFEYQEDSRVISTATLSLADIFGLLPQLRSFFQHYSVTVRYRYPSISKETMVELYTLLTAYRISETVSDGVNDFITYLDREIHA